MTATFLISGQDAMASSKPDSKAHNHHGHRQRLKDRAQKGNLNTFYDHQLLELLLFYAIPRRDTNDLAHALIERFGSFRAVLEAELEDLESVEGMGTSSALLIKAIKEAAVRYETDDGEVIYYYDNLKKIVRYLQKLYFGETREISYALLFDNRMKLLDAVKIGEGTVNASPVNLRTLVEHAVRKHAAAVILAHNHPDGILSPSYDDMANTRQIYDFLRQVSIPLLEHIIVSGKEAYPIMHYSGQFHMEHMCGNVFGEEFYHRFFRLSPEKGMDRYE